jgi:hypothetical protein
VINMINWTRRLPVEHAELRTPVVLARSNREQMAAGLGIRNPTERDETRCETGTEQMTWRPYLPEPGPALSSRAILSRCPSKQSARHVVYVRTSVPRLDSSADGPQEVKRAATTLRLTSSPSIRSGAAYDGMGGDDGYYATLLHELLHATGHQARLARATTGDFSPAGNSLEEGTTLAAQRIVLREIGFSGEALEWHAPKEHGLPVDRRAARNAAAWLLQ